MNLQKYCPKCKIYISNECDITICQICDLYLDTVNNYSSTKQNELENASTSGPNLTPDSIPVTALYQALDSTRSATGLIAKLGAELEAESEVRSLGGSICGLVQDFVKDSEPCLEQGSEQPLERLEQLSKQDLSQNAILGRPIIGFPKKEIIIYDEEIEHGTTLVNQIQSDMLDILPQKKSPTKRKRISNEKYMSIDSNQTSQSVGLNAQESENDGDNEDNENDEENQYNQDDDDDDGDDDDDDDYDYDNNYIKWDGESDKDTDDYNDRRHWVKSNSGESENRNEDDLIVSPSQRSNDEENTGEKNEERSNSQENNNAKGNLDCESAQMQRSPSSETRQDKYQNTEEQPGFGIISNKEFNHPPIYHPPGAHSPPVAQPPPTAHHTGPHRPEPRRRGLYPHGPHSYDFYSRYGCHSPHSSEYPYGNMEPGLPLPLSLKRLNHDENEYLQNTMRADYNHPAYGAGGMRGFQKNLRHLEGSYDARREEMRMFDGWNKKKEEQQKLFEQLHEKKEKLKELKKKEPALIEENSSVEPDGTRIYRVYIKDNGWVCPLCSHKNAAYCTYRCAECHFGDGIELVFSQEVKSSTFFFSNFYGDDNSKTVKAPTKQPTEPPTQPLTQALTQALTPLPTGTSTAVLTPRSHKSKIGEGEILKPKMEKIPDNMSSLVPLLTFNNPNWHPNNNINAINTLTPLSIEAPARETNNESVGNKDQNEILTKPRIQRLSTFKNPRT